MHQHPELGFEEYNTADFIVQTLSQHGLKPVRIAETGVYVDIEGAHAGKKVAYRADIDALPIQDAKTVSYCSKMAGKAHLCGHDAHTTIALGIALNLAERREALHGTARIFFQPNEEGSPSGAPIMIREGVLDGVSAVYGIHVDPMLQTGTVGLKVGASTAACDTFRIEINGVKTGHSARPHEVVDTIWVMHQIMNQLYQLVGRITDSRNPAILTICQISGGDAVNVIPQMASFGGTLRVADNQDLETLRLQFIEIVESLCKLYEATPNIHYRKGAPAVMNDAQLHRTLQQTLQYSFPDISIFEILRPSMGAEDFAHYGLLIPAYLMRLGTQNSPETAFSLHDARFDLDESALPIAVEVMSQVLINEMRE